MTPKEKSKELIDKFGLELSADWDLQLSPDIHVAKQCALICVDELILNNSEEFDFVGVTYWREVKQEIEKL